MGSLPSQMVWYDFPPVWTWRCLWLRYWSTTAPCTHYGGIGYLRYGQLGVCFSVVQVNTACCTYWREYCFVCTLCWYGVSPVWSRSRRCLYNVAWIGFLVNCDVMGFLRYGQRDTSLYNVGVNTIFCTHCDDIVYRQWDVCFYEIDMNEYCFRYTLCSNGLSRVWTEPCISVFIMLTWRLFQVHVVCPWLLCGMENISLSIMLSWIVLPVHTVALWAYPSRLPYGYFRETHWNSMGLLEITMKTLTSVCGPRMGPPRPAPTARSEELLGARNSWRLFQKSIPAARHGRPLRPALPNFWNKRPPY